MMRSGVTIAALCCLACAATPCRVHADDRTDVPRTEAQEAESPLSGLKEQLPDRGQLQSLLGSLIRHISAPQGPGVPAQDVAPPQPESGSRFTDDGDLLPPPPSPVPSPVPEAEVQELPPVQPVPVPAQYDTRRSRRHSAFSQRLLSRRMALIERIRADAVASGDTEMAARSEQLGAFVMQLHEVGLAGMAQRLGELGSLGGGASSAAAGTVEFPETDFGAPAELGAPIELGAPAELGAPESLPRELPPPELPPPAVPE